jgi:hypothetical protein
MKKEETKKESPLDYKQAFFVNALESFFIGIIQIQRKRRQIQFLLPLSSSWNPIMFTSVA